MTHHQKVHDTSPKKYMTQPFVFNYHLILVFFYYIVILRTFIYVRKEKYIWLKNRITFGKMTEILL